MYSVVCIDIVQECSWGLPHWLDSAQHPIPQGDGEYKFIIDFVLLCQSVER